MCSRLVEGLSCACSKAQQLRANQKCIVAKKPASAVRAAKTRGEKVELVSDMAKSPACDRQNISAPVMWRYAGAVVAASDLRQACRFARRGDEGGPANDQSVAFGWIATAEHAICGDEC